MAQQSGRLLHVCLAGPLVCNDQRLIQLLKMFHQVTLVEELEDLWNSPVLAIVGVLVLDNSPREHGMLGMVRALTERQPRLCVLLVDGGLTQAEVARLFQAGACDYFPVPYDVGLLAERVHSLCARPPGRVRQRNGDAAEPNDS
jgi:DNA-binding NtrC family response regulator